MAEHTRLTPQVRSKIARAVAIAGLAAAAVAVTAPVATAGTSSKTFGCYSTWGSTGSNAHCTSTERTGYYRNYAECSWSPDQKSTYEYFWNLTNVPNFGQVDCTFSVNRSYVEFTYGP